MVKINSRQNRQIGNEDHPHEQTMGVKPATPEWVQVGTYGQDLLRHTTHWHERVLAGLTLLIPGQHQQQFVQRVVVSLIGFPNEV